LGGKLFVGTWAQGKQPLASGEWDFPSFAFIKLTIASSAFSSHCFQWPAGVNFCAVLRFSPSVLLVLFGRKEEGKRRDGKTKSKSLEKHHNEHNHPPHRTTFFTIFKFLAKNF
jgi:hypothetical protein